MDYLEVEISVSRNGDTACSGTISGKPDWVCDAAEMLLSGMMDTSMGCQGHTQCPECQNDGKRSKLYVDEDILIESKPRVVFWDEDGRCHKHDPNVYPVDYKCSNGHMWAANRRNTCWCGWPDEAKGES